MEKVIINRFKTYRQYETYSKKQGQITKTYLYSVTLTISECIDELLKAVAPYAEIWISNHPKNNQPIELTSRYYTSSGVPILERFLIKY
jgi:hypothetical protein